jgi:hypothetical protein
MLASHAEIRSSWYPQLEGAFVVLPCTVNGDELGGRSRSTQVIEAAAIRHYCTSQRKGDP